MTTGLPDSPRQSPVVANQDHSAEGGEPKEAQPRVPQGSLGRMLPALSVLLIAVVAAAARHPTTLVLCTGLAVFGLWLNKPPVKRALLCLWGAGMVFFLWHLFTLAPLPVKSLGQPRTEFFEQTHTRLAELSGIEAGRPAFGEWGSGNLTAPHADAAWAVGERGRYGRLSLNQAGTRRFIVIMIGAWAMFWMAMSLNLAQRMRFLAILVVGGAVVAALGLLGQHVVSPGQRVWWLFPVEHQVGGGPFVNRNHFAAFCALLAPAALSLTLAPVPLAGRGLSAPAVSASQSGARRRRRRSVAFGRASERWRNLTSMGRWRLLYAVCLAALVSAPILSLSRGGMVMMLVGCMAAALFWVRGRPLTALAGTVMMIAALFAFLLWPSARVQERIATIRHLHEASPRRAQMMQEGLRQWRDFPLLGGGADSFRTLNGVYRVEPATTSPLYVENEYVQLLADHGLLGALLLLILLAGLLAGFWSSFHERFLRTRSLRVLRGTWSGEAKILSRHLELYESVVSLPIIATAVGVVAGLLFHIYLDFPLRVPLNAFLAAALLGVAMPLPNLTMPERRDYWRWPVLPFCVVALFLLVVWSGDRMRLDEPTWLRRAEADDLRTAILAAPSYWVPWVQLSHRVRQRAEAQLHGKAIGVDDTFDPFHMYGFGVACMERAAELNPRDARLWRALARIGMRESQVDTQKVSRALRNAVLLAPGSLATWQDWLNFTLQQGHYSEVWEIGETAVAEASTGIAVRVWREIRDWARRQSMTGYEYRAVVRLTELQPNRAAWWRERARLEEGGIGPEQAVQSRRRIAELEPDNWRNWMQLGRALLRDGRDDEANRAFRRAIELRPQVREEVERVWRHIKLDR